MNYTVSVKPSKIIFTVFEWIFFDVLLIFPMIMALISNSENMRSDTKFLIFYAVFMAVMQVIFALYLYKMLRPRIRVRGESITVYPRRKKKINITFDEICDEYTVNCGEPVSNTDEASNVLYVNSKVVTFGAEFRFISYFVGGKPIIQIHTKMKNAELFDAEVRKRLGKQ